MPGRSAPRCNSHLGQVFTGEDYDVPTDQRSYINSIPRAVNGSRSAALSSAVPALYHPHHTRNPDRIEAEKLSR